MLYWRDMDLERARCVGVRICIVIPQSGWAAGLLLYAFIMITSAFEAHLLQLADMAQEIKVPSQWTSESLHTCTQ